MKQRKDFPVTVIGDIEITTRYIYENEGVSMFAMSYCVMFNFHPKLKMTPITFRTDRSLNVLLFPKNFFPYINHDNLRSFKDA